MEDSARGLQTRISGLLDTDPSALVPGASPLQQAAFAGASRLEPGSGAGWRDGNATAQSAAAGLLGDRMTAAAPVSPERVASERAVSERVNAQQAGSYMADASPRVSAGSLLDVDLGRYQSPWEDAVVNSTLGNFDEQSGMQRAQLAAQQARGQKFSGSGSAIERALFERGNVRDRAGTEAGLRSAGFDRATGLATQDLDRRAQVDLTEAQRLDSMSRGNADRFTQNNQFNAGQVNSVGVNNAGRADEIAVNNASRGDQVAVNNASRADELALDAARRNDSMTLANRSSELQNIGLLGDLANAGGANERADLGLLSDLGSEERQIAGQQAMAEPALLQIISALNQGQPYDLFKGATTNSTGSGTQASKGTVTGFSGADLAQMAAAAVMASDRRLKTDVEKLGKDRAGRNMYEFRYRGEPKGVRHTGYMAQEIEKTEPQAVFKGPGGYKMINLGLLEDPA